MLEECQLSKHTRDLNILIILFVICGVVMFITMFLQVKFKRYSSKTKQACCFSSKSFLLTKSGEGLTYRLRVRAYRTILGQNLSWFDQTENSSGILCARLATETSAVHQVSSMNVRKANRSLLL